MNLNKNKDFFYKIIPSIPIPLSNSQCFTYSSKQKQGVGDLVLIEFKNRIIKGVILKEIKSIEKPNYRIKEIKKTQKKNFFSKIF
jgi:hypothetical protein